MDFDTLKELYNKPLPFCNWQGDLLHHEEIKANLLELETHCKKCCELDIAEDIIDNLTYLGNCNHRTVFWGLELLDKLKDPNQIQRYKNVKKTVWIIFRWFGQENSFTWD